MEESGDLDEVVVEDAVTGPGSGAVEPVKTGAGKSEVAFGAADAPFATGAPSDHCLERSPVLDLAAVSVRFAFAWEHNMTDTQVV